MLMLLAAFIFLMESFVPKQLYAFFEQLTLEKQIIEVHRPYEVICVLCCMSSRSSSYFSHSSDKLLFVGWIYMAEFGLSEISSKSKHPLIDGETTLKSSFSPREFTGNYLIILLLRC